MGTRIFSNVLSKRPLGLPATLTLVSFSLSLLGQYFHEFWCDEAHVVLIAREAQNLQSLRELQQNNLHPIGYYFIQWIAYSLGGLTLMQVLNAAAVALGCYCITSSPKLSPATRWLLPFSFFPLFQMGVFLRSYSFMYGFIAAYTLLREKERSPAMRITLLFLIGQLHVYGVLFAAVLCLIEEREALPLSLRRPASVVTLLFWLSLAFSFWTLLPDAPASNHQGRGLLFSFALGAQAILPFLITELTFTEGQSLLIGMGGFLYLIMGYLTLRYADHRGRMLLLGTSLPVLLQAAIFYPGQRWHACFLFLMLFIFAGYSGAEAKSARLRHLAAVVLLYQVALGIYAFALDLRAPYSSGAEIAHFLSSQPDAGPVLIGVEGTPSSLAWRNDLAEPVAVYLPSWRMGDPRAAAAKSDPPFSVFYNKPPDFRNCAAAVEELTTYLRNRSLRSVALTSENAGIFRCFAESGAFTVIAGLNARSGFDFGESLSAMIVALGSPTVPN